MGKASTGFRNEWRNILFEAERNLFALKKKSIRMQVSLREEFYLKTGELMRLRGDQVVRDWLLLIEKCERIWKDELVARRSKKFAVLLGSQGQWRRRALSREAIGFSKRFTKPPLAFGYI